MNTGNREIVRVIRARETSDGAGVRLRRSIGATPGDRLDPFLLLDEFGSDAASDYIAGFPAHPHRGFETVTYMLEGEMLHEDHLGNRGRLSSGSVQWMTAARGIIHSEMPQQREGRMHGFQLWLNLPAREKMKEPSYRDIPPDEIPAIDLGDAGEVRVIAGSFAGESGVIGGAVRGISTQPLYLDLRLTAGATLRQPIAEAHNALLYVYDGAARIGERRVEAQHAAVLGSGTAVQVHAGSDGVRALLLAARPLGEPVVQYGPFVMNSNEEIEQALRDYRDGRLTEA